MKAELNELEINGVKYVLKGSTEVEHAGDIKICILQRGWVFVGRFERNGDSCKLHNASTIRIWGTSKGLGELADKGPLKDTVLDKCHGVVEFEALTMVASIACKGESWAKL